MKFTVNKIEITPKLIKASVFSFIFGTILSIIFISYALFGEEDNIILVGLCVGLITILNTFQRKFFQHEEDRGIIEDLKDTLLYTGVFIYAINRFNLNDSFIWWWNVVFYISIYYLVFIVLSIFQNK